MPTALALVWPAGWYSGICEGCRITVCLRKLIAREVNFVESISRRVQPAAKVLTVGRKPDSKPTAIQLYFTALLFCRVACEKNRYRILFYLKQDFQLLMQEAVCGQMLCLFQSENRILTNLDYFSPIQNFLYKSSDEKEIRGKILICLSDLSWEIFGDNFRLDRQNAIVSNFRNHREHWLVARDVQSPLCPPVHPAIFGSR